ncbi:MAG: AbrB/MazE/SpoVT family DNA-binding domain-containing protein [Gemmatimonadetes bacterium]|nr:AbrB/MazE/SpoVT family DNA-binding domain-containing protein [Gemmatimonadota bacterium]
MSTERRVRLFRHGRNQAVRIPREFELPGDEAIVRKDGERLIIEPAPPASLLAVLGALEVVPLEAPGDVAYGRIRAQLERQGPPIGGNDLLIAAQTVTLGCTLVTDNEGVFARVPELRCENWLR